MTTSPALHLAAPNKIGPSLLRPGLAPVRAISLLVVVSFFFFLIPLLGCAAPSIGRLPREHLLAGNWWDIPLDRFVIADDLLAGFGRVEPYGRWRRGDEVLIGIGIENGPDDRKQWYLAIEVADVDLPDPIVVAGPYHHGGSAPVDAKKKNRHQEQEGQPEQEEQERPGFFVTQGPDPLAPIRVHNLFRADPEKNDNGAEPHSVAQVALIRLRVYDQDGRDLGTVHLLIPQPVDPNHRTLLQYLEMPPGASGTIFPPHPDNVDDQWLRTGEMWVSALLYAASRELSPIKPILQAGIKTMVRSPSPLALLHSIALGPAVFRINVAGEIQRVSAPWPGDESYLEALQVPFTATFAREPLVLGSIIITPPHPPLYLAGGHLRCQFIHPTNSQRRVHVRLLGARRGKKGAGYFVGPSSFR